MIITVTRIYKLINKIKCKRLIRCWCRIIDCLVVDGFDECVILIWAIKVTVWVVPLSFSWSRHLDLNNYVSFTPIQCTTLTRSIELSWNGNVMQWSVNMKCKSSIQLHVILIKTIITTIYTATKQMKCQNIILKEIVTIISVCTIVVVNTKIITITRYDLKVSWQVHAHLHYRQHYPFRYLDRLLQMVLS